MLSESDSDQVVVDLLRWCSARGIQIDGRIRLARGEDGGNCVLTRDAFVERRTTLVSIPKSTILSIRNCLLAEHIPQAIYGTEAQLGLALGLYGELLRGSSSPWSGYLQSLPKRVSIALLWDDDASDDEKIALKWIKGTMADVELSMLSQLATHGLVGGSKHTVTDLLRYYEFTALPALAREKLEGHATLEGFKHAYALVSSRSFIVDAYHGPAMVPIADAFNHSSENHVHLESDHEVCHTCGSLTECPHDAEDYGGGERMDARVERALSGSSDFEDTCDMVTNDSISPFIEVFNTYGEHLTNAQLLVRYGFLLDVNENDITAWSARELCRFLLSFVGRSSEEGKKCFDEASASKDCVLGFDVFGGQMTETAGRAATYEHQDITHSHVGDGGIVIGTAGTDMDNEDQILKISSGQVLLERLREVLDLWTCGNSTWANSNLVYLPNIEETELDADSFGEDESVPWQVDTKSVPRSSAVDGNSEACNGDLHFREENVSLRPRQRRKHPQPYFSVNEEAKISLDLWVFCTLLALHAEQLRLHITEPMSADLKPQLDSGGPYSSPRRDEYLKYSTLVRDYATHAPLAERQDSRLSVEGETESDAERGRILTTVEEDVALLRRIVLVQNSMEDLGLDSELDMNPSDVGGREAMYSRASRSESSLINAKRGLRTTAAPIAKGGAQGEPEALLASSSSTISAAHRREVHSDSLRKRVRTSSASSSTSNQSDGAGVRIRFRRNGAKKCVESPREGFEDAHEDTDSDDSETKFGPLEESLSVASRRDRMRDGGLLSALLQAYADDSDSEVQAPSAVGDGFRKGSQLDGEGYLTDVDTRACPARKSEHIPYLPKKEANIFNHDRRADADGGLGPSFLGFATASVSARKLQNVPTGRDSDNASLIRSVASTAHVVSELCATRLRGMAYPNLGAAELGNEVDAIPPEMTQARMAAQLALAERARLEGCAAAWNELELVASHFEH